MQNVQNAAEIQQRVINLVDLYRTKVGKESQIAKDAKEDYEFGSEIGAWGEGPHTEIWIKHLIVNGQLLGHFYAEVSGANADKKILSGLLPEIYDKTIFTEEEELFLKSHFKEMVNYIIKTPSDDEYLKWVNRHDGLDRFVIPDEVIELIISRANIAEGSKIFYPNAGFAQLINQFEDCKFYCDNKNVWMQLAILANNADVEILEDETLPSSYDYVVSYPYGVLDEDAPYDMGKEDKCTKTLISAYNHLNDGGRMILLCPNKLLWSMYPHDLNFFTKDDKGNMNKVLNPIRDIHYEFRHRLIDDGSIVEIIQLPQVMSLNANTRDYSLLIVEKGRTEGVLSMIDARYAFKETKKTNFRKILDLNAFNAMLQNHGCDTETGLRKMVEVSASDLDEQMMIPQVYVIERPSENEHPVPLSSLCQLVTERVRDVKFDLPIDTPWVKNKDLSVTYRGALEIDTLDKANCPNNPQDKSIIDLTNATNWLVDTTPDDFRIAQYRLCTYLDGNRDAVLISFEDERVATALYSTTGKPVVVDGDSWREHVHVLYPNKDVDALSLLSILRMPIVYRQILAYKEFGLYGKYGHLNDILVPSDKRIIHDEVQRLDNEQESYKKQEELLAAKKTEYINEVRMRKHDMGQKVFDLINTEDLMRYYVENRETERDLWSQIEEQLNHFRSTIHELSEMLDHLSQEEQFGTPELLDLNDYLANLQHSNNVNGFKLSYQLDRDSIIDLLMSDKRYKDVTDENSIKIHPIVYIAKNDLQRVVSNILNNAQKHGFVDSSCKDYEVKIRLEFNSGKGMYQIDFRNNGKPLPEGLNKMRYGIKGEKAGKTAGTGLGGSVIKSIVEHYKGDYDVFMDRDWTVIRVYLPIAI